MKRTILGFSLFFLMSLALGCKGGDSSAKDTSSAKNGQAAGGIELKPGENGQTEGSEKDEKAPDKFSVKLETTKKEIIIDVERNWAPLGADRFYTLVKAGYYDDVAFFRVIKGFMAQVGISGNPDRNAIWRKKPIPDDPVTQSNTRGTVSFATAGPNSRTTQFFINFDDNSNLDSSGFAPFGKVRDMAAVDAIESRYGEGSPRGLGPDQGRIQREGNEYLKKYFPKLDYIVTARIVEK